MIQVQDYIEDEEEGVSRAPSSSKEADSLRVGAAVKEDNGPLLSARELNGIGGGAAATTSKKPSFKNSVFERLTATRNKVCKTGKRRNSLRNTLHWTTPHIPVLETTKFSDQFNSDLNP